MTTENVAKTFEVSAEWQEDMGDVTESIVSDDFEDGGDDRVTF
jgi:hypothetical protein